MAVSIKYQIYFPFPVGLIHSKTFINLINHYKCREFRGMVRKMFIYPKEEVDKMNTRRTK